MMAVVGLGHCFKEQEGQGGSSALTQNLGGGMRDLAISSHRIWLEGTASGPKAEDA